MRILAACEMSGAVRDAFAKRGHDAWSCDIVPSIAPGNHILGDAVDAISQKWDLVIAFPPCTHLAVSGAKHFAEKRKTGVQQAAVEFFMKFVECQCDKVVIENPIGIMSTLWRKPDQIIQPWQFGHEFQKSTCLWLKGVPKLVPTSIVGKGEFHVTKSGRSIPKWIHAAAWKKNRSQLRSMTFTGIAEAMADQWGGNL